MIEILSDVREAGRTAFLRHKGLTSACVDAAIEAAIVVDRASRPSLSTDGDGVVELAQRLALQLMRWREIEIEPKMLIGPLTDALALLRTPKAEPSEEARENMHKFARVFGEGLPGELLPIDAFPPAPAPQAESEPVWLWRMRMRSAPDAGWGRWSEWREGRTNNTPNALTEYENCQFYASSQPQPVAIKPLVWLDEPGNDKNFHTIHANPPLAYYAIWWRGSGPYWFKQTGLLQAQYNTLNAAKAAAQADYEARIRTALATPPAQGDMVLPAWSSDWAAAPRDGRYVLLWQPDIRGTQYLRWLTHYGVFGLGGCWTDGLCTMGEGVDFSHWSHAPQPLAASPHTPSEER